MKYLPLIWAGLWRKPLRTVLTFLSIVTAFLLSGVLQGVIAGFDGALAKMSEARLRVVNRANLLDTLPVSYQARIERVPGVRRVAKTTFFVGYYQDPKNSFSGGAGDVDAFLDVFNEIKAPPEQVTAMRNNRTGAMIGVELSRKYGWKIGDRVTLHSLLWVKKDGMSDWTFDIVSISNAGPNDEKTFANEFYVNYPYVDEARATDRGTVNMFAVAVDDPKQNTRIGMDIDKLFANSANETITMNDKEYVNSQLRQAGNIRLFVYEIIGAVLFTLLFLTGNTMMQSVRDRTSELGVLKAIGFANRDVLLMVIAESILLFVAAAGIGLLVATLLVPGIFRGLQLFTPPPQFKVFAYGLLLAVVIACMVGALPAWRAQRLEIVTALARR